MRALNHTGSQSARRLPGSDSAGSTRRTLARAGVTGARVVGLAWSARVGDSGGGDFEDEARGGSRPETARDGRAREFESVHATAAELGPRNAERASGAVELAPRPHG